MLEQNLQDLQTSQVDLAYVHSLGNQDVEQVLGPDGPWRACAEPRVKD